MRKIWILFLFAMLNATVKAQVNLVPNGSLEDTLNCGTPMPYIQHAYPWFNPTSSTPDYFTSISGCGYNWTTLPINRTPHSGIAFAGLFCWDGSGQRDYIETVLSDSLVAGVKYRVGFYVVRSFDSYYATDKIGACFTVDSLLSSTAFNIPVLPQVYNTTGIVYDTSNWVLISGTFIAQGGERFLTIGNFYDNQNCAVDSGTGNFFAGYYYVDDISVVADTAIGIVDWNECYELINNNYSIILKDNCNNTYPDEATIGIYDLQGRTIKQFIFKSFQKYLQININQFTVVNGVYIVNVSTRKFTKSIKLNILKN